MTTCVEYIESHSRTKRAPCAPRLEKAPQEASQSIKRHCLGRLARDLEVRNCLKKYENKTEHPSAAACAAEVSNQLERLNEGLSFHGGSDRAAYGRAAIRNRAPRGICPGDAAHITAPSFGEPRRL